MADDDDSSQTLLNRLAHHTIGLFCHHAPTRPDDTLQEGYITATAFIMEIKGL
jgi:hypothetical protein